MHFFKRLGFTRLEGLLGLSVILAVILAVVPVMRRNLNTEEMARAGMGAELIARAALDYNTETGRWPQQADGTADLCQLTSQKTVSQAGMGPETLVGSMMSQTAQAAPAQLAEVPLDPWQRPYRVTMLPVNGQGGHADGNQEAITILVLSAGENGKWETGPELINQIHQAISPSLI